MQQIKCKARNKKPSLSGRAELVSKISFQNPV
jgi:hypothetical protein